MANPVIAVRVPQDVLDRIDAQAERDGTDRATILRPVIAAAFPEQATAGAAMANPRTKLRPVPPLRRA